MELSIRLRAVADLVTAGYTLADIGTDHAYLPISLIQEGRIPSAVAMDVNRGPLEMARAHVSECGCHDKVALRLSDGFSAVRPGEVQSAVIAGMGGALVIRILREGADVVRSLKECILQPQSELDKVRAFLLEEGFFFLAEDMVRDDGKYYPMMKVVPPGADAERLYADRAEEKRWSQTELTYGRLLLLQKNETLRAYLQREIRIRKEILSQMQANDSDRARQRQRELTEELRQAETAMQAYIE